MIKYIVVSYCKITSVCDFMVFETLEKAYKYICNNTLVDLKNNEYDLWVYKIITIDLFEGDKNAKK